MTELLVSVTWWAIGMAIFGAMTGTAGYFIGWNAHARQERDRARADAGAAGRSQIGGCGET